VLAIGVVVCLTVLLVRLRRHSDPGRKDRLRAVREQEAINLARRMWMSGGE
jgi:hypothetical protein